MRSRSHPSSRAWLLLPLFALGFLAWATFARVQRVDAVSRTDSDGAVIDATSPTGYADGKRWLIVPEHANRSYQWVAETQQMLATGEIRVRHVDYDNAPFGRAVHAASPYRWWLGFVAWCDHALSGRPIGLSAERAALFAGPVLHLLLIVTATIFAARRFGHFPAALLAAGLATIYPFAGGFLPGVPDDRSLAWTFNLGGMLLLLAGVQSRAPRDFLAAGVCSGLGLWISPVEQLPVLAGIFIGAGVTPLLARRGESKGAPESSAPLPWRMWALGGATCCVAAYLIEYFPAHMDFQLRAVHPLYGLVWLAVGELLAQLGSAMQPGKSPRTKAAVVRLALASAVLAGCVVFLGGNGALTWLISDPSAARLSYLPNGVVAQNSFAWVARDGLTGPVVATWLSLLALGVGVVLILQRKTDSRQRAALALASGPALLTLVLACGRLSWWNQSSSLLLLVLVVAAAFAESARAQGLWSALAAVVFLPGLLQLCPPRTSAGDIEFTPLEAQSLIERGLAHWIADHATREAGGAVILTPPDRTTSWCFHGGLRGIGSANWENRDGLEATIHIATATTVDEALALLTQRDIRYLILPSWDTDLDEFARWRMQNPEDAFIMALHHWALPPWLRPLPYKLPTVAGFENQSVVILQVTSESNRAAAVSRLAEYFVETEQLDLAASAGQSLQRYPTDLGALVALAQVEKARGDTAGFAKSFEALSSGLAAGFDRTLAWDRRVSLAVVLVQGDRQDLAREQVRRCLEKLDEAKIRSLTTGALFRLQVLAKAFGLPIADPRLRDLAAKLLPPELRARL